MDKYAIYYQLNYPAPAVYAQKDCPDCQGKGMMDVWEPEPYGETDQYVYKGEDYCWCLPDGFHTASFAYWSPWQRSDLPLEVLEDVDIPF